MCARMFVCNSVYVGTWALSSVQFCKQYFSIMSFPSWPPCEQDVFLPGRACMNTCVHITNTCTRARATARACSSAHNRTYTVLTHICTYACMQLCLANGYSGGDNNEQAIIKNDGNSTVLSTAKGARMRGLRFVHTGGDTTKRGRDGPRYVLPLSR